MKRLKIDFINFWKPFYKTNNYFYNLLSTKYDVIIDVEHPDLTFYSCFGYETFRHNSKKIFYTGECMLPNWDDYDLSFTFEYGTNDKNYRLPLWVFYLNWFNKEYSIESSPAYLGNINLLLNKQEINIFEILENKTKFCNFIYTNPSGRRMTFYHRLNDYFKGRVESPGKLFNNTGYILGGGHDGLEKIQYLNQFKFSISFENKIHNGYTTEKILQPMFVNSIPIYWGNPNIHSDFNENSFINANKYTDEELIDYIDEVDSNYELYFHILEQPWFVDNKIPNCFLPANVLEAIENVL